MIYLCGKQCKYRVIHLDLTPAIGDWGHFVVTCEADSPPILLQKMWLENSAVPFSGILYKTMWKPNAHGPLWQFWLEEPLKGICRKRQSQVYYQQSAHDILVHLIAPYALSGLHTSGPLYPFFYQSDTWDYGAYMRYFIRACALQWCWKEGVLHLFSPEPLVLPPLLPPPPPLFAEAQLHLENHSALNKLGLSYLTWYSLPCHGDHRTTAFPELSPYHAKKAGYQLPGQTTRRVLVGFLDKNPTTPLIVGYFPNKNTHHAQNTYRWQLGPKLHIACNEGPAHRFEIMHPKGGIIWSNTTQFGIEAFSLTSVSQQSTTISTQHQWRVDTWALEATEMTEDIEKSSLQGNTIYQKSHSLTHHFTEKWHSFIQTWHTNAAQYRWKMQSGIWEAHSIQLKAKTAVFQAKEKLTITLANSSITLTPRSITLRAPQIQLAGSVYWQTQPILRPGKAGTAYKISLTENEVRTEQEPHQVLDYYTEHG